MHNRNKKIFKHISTSWQGETYFGVEIVKWLAPIDTVALYFDVLNSRCYLIHQERERDKQLNILIELLSYLDYAAENHFIYVVEEDSLPRNNYLFYENIADCRPLQQNNIFDIGNNLRLKIDGDNNCSIFNSVDNSINLPCSIDISFLYKKLSHYLFANIHGTKGLNSFISHNYLSNQDYYSERAICVSTISIILAIFMALVSPFLSLWLNNNYGEITIKQRQYEEISSAIDSIAKNTREPIVSQKTKIRCDTNVVKNKKGK